MYSTHTLLPSTSEYWWLVHLHTYVIQDLSGWCLWSRHPMMKVLWWFRGSYYLFLNGVRSMSGEHRWKFLLWWKSPSSYRTLSREPVIFSFFFFFFLSFYLCLRITICWINIITLQIHIYMFQRIIIVIHFLRFYFSSFSFSKFP